jgi:hypothetical protein
VPRGIAHRCIKWKVAPHPHAEEGETGIELIEVHESQWGASTKQELRVRFKREVHARPSTTFSDAGRLG